MYVRFDVSTFEESVLNKLLDFCEYDLYLHRCISNFVAFQIAQVYRF